MFISIEALLHLCGVHFCSFAAAGSRKGSTFEYLSVFLKMFLELSRKRQSKVPVCCEADMPRQWRASDDAAAGSGHDAADPAAMLPLQSDRLRHAAS